MGLSVLWRTCYKEINRLQCVMTNVHLQCYLCRIGCKNCSIASLSEISQPVKHIYFLWDRISNDLCREEINTPSLLYAHILCTDLFIWLVFGFKVVHLCKNHQLACSGALFYLKCSVLCSHLYLLSNQAHTDEPQSCDICEVSKETAWFSLDGRSDLIVSCFDLPPF